MISGKNNNSQVSVHNKVFKTGKIIKYHTLRLDQKPQVISIPVYCPQHSFIDCKKLTTHTMVVGSLCKDPKIQLLLVQVKNKYILYCQINFLTLSTCEHTIKVCSKVLTPLHQGQLTKVGFFFMTAKTFGVINILANTLKLTSLNLVYLQALSICTKIN